jgi:hypothetical protein
MHKVIKASIKSLEKSIKLLSLLSDDNLSNSKISPYYSSVGSHIRHILDFYSCIIYGYQDNYIDLTDRKRDQRIENNCDFALGCTQNIILELKAIEDLNKKVIVNDDLGLGDIKIEYSIASLLAQANSHTIHHYALINYILDGLGIKFEDEDFGFNPSTPKTLEN